MLQDMGEPTRPQGLSGEWLRQRASTLSKRVVSRQYAIDPTLKKKYGPPGRHRCQEDASYHLRFLAEAAEANNSVHFIDYVRWAKPMLAGRRIPWQHLEKNLEIMGGLIAAARPPKPVSEFVHQAIDDGLRILPEAPEELPSLVEADNPDHEVCNGYLRALLGSDREKAHRLVRDYLEGGNSIRSVFVNVCGAAQREIGRLWQVNLISVAQEHFCTAATEVIMARLSERLIGRPRSCGLNVVAMCPPSEEHSVGLQMICELLELEGWPTHFLGPKVPVSSAVSFVAGMMPAFVLISVSTALRISEATKLVAAIRAAAPQTKIIVGGRIFENDPQLGARVGAHGVGKDPNEAVNLIERLSA
jgi:methanogenic corrinoid protein MtbC1